MVNRPLLSIVIPVLNSEKSLRKTLDSIFGQKTSLPFEVLIIDNGSRDRSLKIATSYPLKLLSHPRKGASSARNEGVRLSQGRFIAFVDSDVILSPDWIENAVHALSSPLWDVVQGSNVPSGDEDRFMTRIRRRVNSIITSGSGNYLEVARLGVPQLNTAAVALKSALMVGEVAFDEKLLRCEDTDLGLQLLYRGAHFKSVGDMKSKVFDDRSPWAYIQRSFSTGRHLTAVSRKWNLPIVCPRVFSKRGGQILERTYISLLDLARILGQCWPTQGPKIQPRVRELKRNLILVNLRDSLGRSWRLDPGVRLVSLQDRLIFLQLRDFSRCELWGEEKIWFEDCLSQSMVDDRPGITEKLREKGILILSEEGELSIGKDRTQTIGGR